MPGSGAKACSRRTASTLPSGHYPDSHVCESQTAQLCSLCGCLPWALSISWPLQADVSASYRRANHRGKPMWAAGSTELLLVVQGIGAPA